MMQHPDVGRGRLFHQHVCLTPTRPLAYNCLNTTDTQFGTMWSRWLAAAVASVPDWLVLAMRENLQMSFLCWGGAYPHAIELIKILYMRASQRLQRC
jgi:hypothetical protein